jgi:glutamate---cysteine ligase / carboxylate-amine ligase
MADGTAPSAGILDGVRERFEGSTDFTVGIEEEYQLLDPATLALTGRYEDLMAAAEEPLRDRLAGELIASEIEYRTGRHLTFADAARELVEGRLATLALADRLGIALGVTGVHPFSPWTEQRIIDTPHYRRVEEELGYIAWTNNTWSLHLHAGVRGADRAVAVSTAMRSVLPELLALSANSAVFGGRPTRLHSTRVQIFTKSFPRCGVPDAFAGWDDYAAFVALLERTGSIVESTQIWWSVRPHHSFGTVEVRICDGQTEMGEALAVAALTMACIAAFAADRDAGRPLPAHARGLIEENIWRAQRHGLEGRLIDLDRGVERSTAAAIEDLLAWSAPVHEPLGLGPFLAGVPAMLAAGNGAMRQRARLAELGDVRAMHAEVVDRTRRSAEEALEMAAAAGAA